MAVDKDAINIENALNDSGVASTEDLTLTHFEASEDTLVQMAQNLDEDILEEISRLVPNEYADTMSLVLNLAKHAATHSVYQEHC